MKPKEIKGKYKRKKVDINRERFFYSPNMLDLSEREVDVVKISKDENWWQKFKKAFRFKAGSSRQARCPGAIDFLKAKERWRIPKKVGKKIVNQVGEWDLPKFVDKLLYDKDSKVHRKLEKIGLKFEKHPILNKFRNALLFLLVCLILLLPIQAVALKQNFVNKKDEILAHSMEGYQNVKEAQVAIEAGDFSLAKKDFQAAEESFLSAEKELGWWRVFIPLTSKVVKETSAYYLLESARIVSQSGAELTGWVADLKKDIKSSEFDDEELDFGMVLDRVDELAQKRDELESRVVKVENYLAKIDSSVLDPDQVAKIEPMKQEVLRFLDILEILPDFLAKDSLRSYLVIFQNSHELRATGGFMGSIALIDVIDGRISNIDIPGGGPYDLSSGFTKNVLPPEPMLRINQKWELQDTNWWPDFETSAKKIAWQYENSDQPTVDGVIAINSDIMPKLLKIFGPINLDEYQKTITADNFYEVTQQQVEFEYDSEENKPKQFIADLFFLMLDDLIDNFSFENDKQIEFVADILSQIDESLRNRDIQIYSRNEDLQQKLIQLSMAGKLENVGSDYLMIVNSNLGGDKTDEVIEQQAKLTVDIETSNSIVNTLKITRKHNGKIGNSFTGVANKNYLRVYVPLGSELIDSLGFTQPERDKFFVAEDYLEVDEYLEEVETNDFFDHDLRVYQEDGKTVFAGWIDLPLGEAKTVMLKYELPFKFNDDYELYLQKQSGSKPFEFRGFLSEEKIEQNIDNDYIWQPLTK